ncbi:MAG: long-chain-acyl-CoA synthetase, partial [Deltaproteobacteria bacterium]|nr:long-chain-acyl-CoA synthetase [Deltaproteobacteria bacterium]
KDLKPGRDVRLYFLQDRGVSGVPAGYIDWNLATRDAASENPPTTPDITMKDPFAHVFTSGTTGMPKAAVTLHNRWALPLMLFGRMMLRLTPHDTIYIPLPFYHGTALYAGWPTAAAGGAAMAIRRKFSASNFWKDVDRFNATAFVYIGELCRYLMQQPPDPRDGKNKLTKILGSGLRPEMWKEFKSRFGIKEVYEFYGASESNFAFANVLNLDCTVGTCPLPFAIVKYDIADEKPVKDENGFFQRAEVGEAGLLLGQISDEAPFVGYTDEEATKKKILRNVFETGDAWYDSGDLLRDIGFKHVQFVDRLGDTFRWKGENVSTTQVEAVINSFDHILESNVYGVTIPATNGRVGMAAVITDRAPADFDLAGLFSTLKTDLPSYAVPIFIRFKTEFETTAASMKIKKGNLKREAFDPNQVSDPLYVLLPGNKAYVPLTEDIYSDIMDGIHKY